MTQKIVKKTVLSGGSAFGQYPGAGLPQGNGSYSPQNSGAPQQNPQYPPAQDPAYPAQDQQDPQQGPADSGQPPIRVAAVYQINGDTYPVDGQMTVWGRNLATNQWAPIGRIFEGPYGAVAVDQSGRRTPARRVR
jgi:hypothetical protein